MYKREPLSKDHDREGFDCGSEPLNLFLRQTSRQHAERGISRTFVLVEEGEAAPKPVVGFFSLSLCQVRSETLPAKEAKRLPREAAAVRLGRLAVAKARQGQGVGGKLLVLAMAKFLEIFEVAGGIGLFVDAKDHAVRNYYESFGFVPLTQDGLELFLSVRAIKECLTSLPDR